MKFANQAGRAVVIADDGVVDVAEASSGAFGSDPADAFRDWPALRAWAATGPGATGPLREELLGPPSPSPRQVFGIGMNYRVHAAEAGAAVPEVPLTFTKFPSSLNGPCGDITLTGPRVDWEVELVVVIGATASAVTEADAWSHVAGVTLGQDVSDRDVQARPRQTPQFSLGKSRPGFGPCGPLLVTPDELADPDDVELTCSVNGEEVQRGRTADLIFPVPELIAYLSHLVTLLPGDLVFTGTPPGVGMSRTPPRFLGHGDLLLSHAPEIGTMRHRFVDPV